MDQAEVARYFFEDDIGKLFQKRLNACLQAGLLRPATVLTDLIAQLADRATSRFDLPLLARQLLPGLVDAACHDDLCSHHQQAGVAPFDALRVLTADAFRVHYTDPVPEFTADGLPVSGSGRAPFERDADFGPSDSAQVAPGAAPARRLKPVISLCEPGRPAFITRAEDWQQAVPGAAARADAAGLAQASAHWLALACASGTTLTALVLPRGTPLGWQHCRRPTLLDADDLSWWWCWPDDPLHCGHTVALADLGIGKLQRSAREWVTEWVQIPTAGGGIQPIPLGETQVSTLPQARDCAEAWQHFLGMAPPGT